MSLKTYYTIDVRFRNKWKNKNIHTFKSQLQNKRKKNLQQIIKPGKTIKKKIRVEKKYNRTQLFNNTRSEKKKNSKQNKIK